MLIFFGQQKQTTRNGTKHSEIKITVKVEGTTGKVKNLINKIYLKEELNVFIKSNILLH